MASSKLIECNTCKTEVGCDNCSLFGVLRLVGDFLEEEPETVERVLRRREPVTRGENLFQTGDTFRAVYAIKKGSFKTYTWLSDGKEQVIGFHFPGELLGLDSVRSPNYSCTAEALEEGNVCQLQFDDLDLLGTRLPQFQEQLIRLLSTQILMDQRQSLILGRQRAEERLAAFLLDLSNRFKVRGLPYKEFRIAMSRQDIASYLGLALESISRHFTHLQEQGLLKVSGKLVILKDLRAMEELIRTPNTNP